MMSLYIDSADQAEVTRLLATGLFSGVTTNPSILDRAGLGSRDVPAVIEWATAAGAERVFAQVWGDTADAIVSRARALRAVSDRVVVKVAYSAHGITAARELADDGDVLITGIHRGWQVVPVLASRAAYVAPFVARMDTSGRDGMAETIAMQKAVDATNAGLQVLAGSVRTPDQILTLIQAGVRNVTFGPAVWQEFFEDDVTLEAVANFERLADAHLAVRAVA
jgi:TalC/MipB family fructose-6-phosphate aldolase